MPGRIDEIQLVGLTVIPLRWAATRVRLDGDATLALDRIAVEDLRLHFTIGQAAADLDEAIGQGRLAVIDVRDN